MEYVMEVLVSILLLFNGITLYMVFKSKKENQSLAEKTKLDNQKWLKKAQQLNEETLNGLLEFSKENLYSLHEKTNELLKYEISENSREMKLRLDHYIEEEKVELYQWGNRIEEYTGTPSEKLDMLESAINKYPGHRPFIEAYIINMDEIKKSGDLTVHKKAIERLNRVTRVFLDNCPSKDYDYARMTYLQSLKDGNEFMDKLNQLHTKKVKTKFTKIRTILEKRHLYNQNSIVNELEQLDNEIDVKWLQQFPDLLAEYKEISQSVMDLFSPVEIGEEHMDSYNREAIRCIDQAYQKFQKNEYSYKEGEKLRTLTKLLGGWNTEYFYVATNTYYQSVYNEIFGKLNAKVKPVFTKEIVSSAKKAVS